MVEKTVNQTARLAAMMDVGATNWFARASGLKVAEF